MKKIEFSWDTSDNIPIYGLEWKPNDEPKGVIALVHGLGEHCNRYQHVAEFYAKAGFATVAYDRRGHGKSGGKRGHTSSFNAFLDEITQLLDEVSERYPNLPVILYGHSMGGNLVLNYLIRKNPSIKLLIATAPWIKLAFEPSKFMVTLGRLSRKIAPGLTQPSGLNVDHISKDKKEVEKYSNDPLVHGKITSATGMDMMDAAQYLVDFSGVLPVPTLLMHAEEDQLTSMKGTEAFSKKAQGDITFKVWENMYHEIHNEVDREKVFQFTLDWINSKW